MLCLSGQVMTRSAGLWSMGEELIQTLDWKTGAG